MLDQLNKMKVQQIQDQKFSNDTLLRVLATAEGYAIKKCKGTLSGTKRKYGYYDTFGNTENREIDDIEKQLMFGKKDLLFLLV